ncbi:MAG: hypothetical protein WBP81_24095, partial [Solirubrobacteraceae bacterium]
AAHRAQDHPNPCDSGAVAAVMSGIRRQVGTDQLRRAAPLELERQEGNLVAVSVAPVPTPDVGVAVVHFSGTVERATEDALGDGVGLHLRSHPRLPAAMVHLT